MEPSFKKPVDTLTYDNWKDWFELFQLWAGGKGIDFILRKTIAQYAYTSTTSTNWTPNSSDQAPQPATRPLEVLDLLESLQIVEETPLKGCWDEARLGRWKMADATVRYTLKICLDSIDNILLAEHNTVKGAWEELKRKYSRVQPVDARGDLAKLTSFEWRKDLTIESAWTEIKAIQRRVILAKPNIGNSFTEEDLIQSLIHALPAQYEVTVTTIDAQPSLTTSDRIRMLRNREDLIRKGEEEAAMAARQTTATPKTTCVLCEEPHKAVDCPFRKAVLKLASKEGSLSQKATSFSKATNSRRKHQYRQADQNTRRQYESKPHSNHDPNRRRPRSDRYQRKPNQSGWRESPDWRKREQGYTAEQDPQDNQSDSDYVSTSSSIDEEVEFAHLTQARIRKDSRTIWCSDSCASSHMTDNQTLFRGPLISIGRRIIQVGGGQLYADYMGTVEIQIGEGSILISDVLYVPNLGVNLLSSKKLCSKGLKFTGDNKSMAFWEDQQKILEASVTGGVYTLTWIRPNLDDNAFYTNQSDDQYTQPVPDDQYTQPSLLECQHIDPEIAYYEKESELKAKDLEQYRLWHERCGHAGPEVIRKLHKRTNIEKVKVPSDREVCITCRLAKMRKKMSKELSPWKETILALVYADIAGPFHTSLRGHQYMAKLVDSASRCTWVVLGKDRKDIVRNLRNWKTIVERQADLPLMAIRIDNATELRALLKEWATQDGIKEENTVPHSSFQNGPAEKSIQTSENDFRAMLKGQQLPLEFWDEAALTGAYIRNRVMDGPAAGEKDILTI